MRRQSKILRIQFADEPCRPACRLCLQFSDVGRFRMCQWKIFISGMGIDCDVIATLQPWLAVVQDNQVDMEATFFSQFPCYNGNPYFRAAKNAATHRVKQRITIKAYKTQFRWACAFHLMCMTGQACIDAKRALDANWNSFQVVIPL